MEREIEIKNIQSDIKNGNYSKALKESNSILRLDPNNIVALNCSGLSLQGLNKYKESESIFLKAILVQDDYVPALNNLANTYKALFKFDEARKIYKKILNLNPNYIPALNGYALLEYNTNNLDLALLLYKKLLTLNKKNEIYLYMVATIKSHTGNFNEAILIFKKIIKINPKNTVAHKFLSTIISYADKESQNHFNEIKKLITDNTLNDRQIVDIAFSLGKAYEENKDYDKSFHYYELANNTKKKYVKYNPNQDINLFQSIVEVFENFDFTKIKRANSGKKIIFICGMPRSGTTLIEQILSSHKKILGAGELYFLEESISKYLMIDKRIKKKKFTESVNKKENIILKTYNEKLDLLKINSDYITDKAPLNFRWIGFIKIFFPQAKVIHCYREPKDNCLSLFKNNFVSNSLNWTFSQKEIANYYNQYLNLMSFWEKKIPNYIYNLKYENIVNNKEYEIKKLVNFCNLEWDVSCLNHRKNKDTSIKTASVQQARKNIYSSSLNTYKNFEKSLKEMNTLIKKK